LIDVTAPNERRAWRPRPGEPLATFSHANASFLTPYLAIGGDLDTAEHDLALGQLEELGYAGITHVIDVRIECSDEEWVRERNADVEYLHLGIDDAGQRVPGVWFDEGVAFAREAIESDGVVLAHCHMGINRGPSMGFAILLGVGWDAREALDAIHAARPIAFVAYAEDALRWHHTQDSPALAADLQRVHEWRRDNELDLDQVLRVTRVRDDPFA
jgi:protein-tyrosine phosphatase